MTLNGAQWDHTIKTMISQFQTVETFSTSVDQPAYPGMTILKEPFVELDAIVVWKGANGLRWADKILNPPSGTFYVGDIQGSTANSFKVAVASRAIACGGTCYYPQW